MSLATPIALWSLLYALHVVNPIFLPSPPAVFETCWRLLYQDVMDLTKFAGVLQSQLSGGMRQRTAIARSLAA